MGRVPGPHNLQGPQPHELSPFCRIHSDIEIQDTIIGMFPSFVDACVHHNFWLSLNIYKPNKEAYFEVMLFADSIKEFSARNEWHHSCYKKGP